MRRPTLILLIVFILLGALLWYMQQPGNPIKSILATSTPTQSDSVPSLLISPDKGPIRSISIQDANGKSVLISKKAGQWIVNDGQNKAADQSGAESAAGHVLNLPVTKKFDTAPDPAGTGLNNPTYIISVTLADASIFSFTVGKPTVTGSGYYVRASGDTVYILSKSELDSLTLYLTQPPIFMTPTAPVTETNIPAQGTPPASTVAPTSTP